VTEHTGTSCCWGWRSAGMLLRERRADGQHLLGALRRGSDGECLNLAGRLFDAREDV